MSIVNGHAPGIIGITASYLGRYREFDVALSGINAPSGSKVEWFVGINIARNFNLMVEKIFADEKFRWLWILGDDHVFMPELLIKLIERDVDVVVPLCLRRNYPYIPVLHTSAEDGYVPVPWEKLEIQGKKGLLDWSGKTCGNAGMLVKREVFQTIPKPWFETGRTAPDLGGCDLYFCEKLNKAGIPIYIDLDNRIGHIVHTVIWPHQDENGEWEVDMRSQ